MIIYPQINNLRIITIPLTVVLIALSYYCISSYNSIKEYEHFLEEENNIVATELFDMVFAYHDIEIENENILRQLTASKEKISSVLDSVQNITPTTQLLISYRKQLLLLKEENKQILNLVQELNAENEFLKVQADYVSQELEYSKNKVSNYERKNAQLNKNNLGLNKKLNEASVLIVNNVSVDPIVRFRNNNSIVTTKKARRTKKLNVCFSVQENKTAKKGNQEYFIQIIDPNNNVVGDQGSIKIGNNTLIVSSRITVDYNNQEVNICEYIEPSKNEKFEKGTYYVSIYNATGLVEKTVFDLK